jgi:hypothetical protein
MLKNVCVLFFRFVVVCVVGCKAVSASGGQPSPFGFFREIGGVVSPRETMGVMMTGQNL